MRKDAGLTLPGDPSKPVAGRPAPPRSASDVLVTAGYGTFVAVFVTEPALVLVLDTGVQLLDREGAELMRWDAPRQLTAAALDDHLLSVADGAIVTTLDLDESLREVSRIQLVESCQSAAFVASNRLVCGSITTRRGIHGMYVFDVQASKLLSRLDYELSDAIALGRVPDSARLLATSEELALFALNADDRLELVTSMRTNTGVSNDVYAFEGTHLITSSGKLRTLAAADCMAPAPAASTSCLSDVGSLYTLWEDQAFAALHATDGMLYGLVHDRRGPGCQPCSMVRISLETRELLGERIYSTLYGQEVHAFAFDAESSRMLVVYGDEGSYRVELLSLESM